MATWTHATLLKRLASVTAAHVNSDRSWDGLDDLDEQEIIRDPSVLGDLTAADLFEEIRTQVIYEQIARTER